MKWPEIIYLDLDSTDPTKLVLQAIGNVGIARVELLVDNKRYEWDIDDEPQIFLSRSSSSVIISLDTIKDLGLKSGDTVTVNCKVYDYELYLSHIF
jgi:hypothetical protein